MDYTRLKFERHIYGHTLEMAKMYSIFSNINMVEDVCKQYPIDIGTHRLVELISFGANKSFNITYNDEKSPKMFPKAVNNDNVVVCFSGGKDSTAAALLMRDKGFDVNLYYIKGINKSYPNELERAKEIANYLKMPLYVEKVSQKGKTTFHDNPIKNQLIASMALDFAVENNFSHNIVFGDFYTDNIRNSSFLEAWSDCIEMWQQHEIYVRNNFVEDYKIHIPFKNYIQTIDIVSKDKQLLNLVQGCVLPHRFRESVKQNNEKKFGIELLPQRCGSCWKCCTEYIHLADIGVMPYNKQFYKHCLNFLKNKMDVLRPNIKERDLPIVYKAFLYEEFIHNSALVKNNDY